MASYSCMFCDWTSPSKSEVNIHINANHSEAFLCEGREIEKRRIHGTAGPSLGENQMEELTKSSSDVPSSASFADYDIVQLSCMKENDLLKCLHCDTVLIRQLFEGHEETGCKKKFRAGKNTTKKALSIIKKLHNNVELVEKGEKSDWDRMRCLQCSKTMNRNSFVSHWRVAHTDKTKSGIRRFTKVADQETGSSFKREAKYARDQPRKCLASPARYSDYEVLNVSRMKGDDLLKCLHCDKILTRQLCRRHESSGCKKNNKKKALSMITQLSKHIELVEKGEKPDLDRMKCMQCLKIVNRKGFVAHWRAKHADKINSIIENNTHTKIERIEDVFEEEMD